MCVKVANIEIGRYGWVMQVAFISWAVSCVALFVAVLSQVRTIGGWIGLASLLLSATGLIIAAFGVSDPPTATKDQLTAHGKLHGLGPMLGIASLPIAAVLTSLSLARNQGWFSARRSFLWSPSNLD
jgi:hypothetical protein